MNQPMVSRATKLIKSLDADHLELARLPQLLEEGWDALRIVYPKGPTAKLASFLAQIRQAMQKQPYHRAVIIDLCPRPRAEVSFCQESAADLVVGQKVLIALGEKAGDLRLNLSIAAGDFFVSGARMFLGYGNVELKINSCETDFVTAEVLKGGNVEVGMDAHIPFSKRSDTLNDLSAIDFAMLRQHGVDHLILSGRLSLSELRQLKSDLKSKYHYEPWIHAKIDSDVAYEQLEQIFSELEGVVVSRKEMSLSINPSMIPMVTKEIIQRANDEAKVVITASEILGSMRKNPTPTRAEVSDVANAVWDGTNAVVLTEEVSAGKYASQATLMLSKIIADAELNAGEARNWKKHMPPVKDEVDAISYSAYLTAERVGARAIVCITQQGNTALRLASFQPPVPIIAVTFAQETVHRLAIVRGVRILYLPNRVAIEEILPLTNSLLKEHQIAEIGDRMVFVSITLSSLSAESSNLFTIQQVW
jgi:pyruvate kinase